MSDLAWWLVAVLALACAVLVGLLWRQRGTSLRGSAIGDRETAPAAGLDRRGGAAASVPPPVPGGGLAPLPGPAAPQRSPVAALVAPPTVRLPALLVAARARRYELRDACAEPALVLERAAGHEWRHAAPAAATTPMQRELLAAVFAHAPLLAASPSAEGDLYRLSLRAGAALPLARSELAATALRVVPAQSLDAGRSAAVAALVMALHCAPVYLRGLRQEVAAIQAEAAPWLRQSSAGDERLRALLQDLSRYLREVEENHAGVIRKPVFVARVADFCVQAEAQWRAASDSATALRRHLVAMAAELPSAGSEWQAKVRDYAVRHRVACSAARMLAAWHGLRLALGEAVPAAALVLRAALQTHRAAGADDAALARSAVARPQPWPAERAAAEHAERALAGTLQAIEAGFAGEAGLTLLVRLDSLGQVRELRGPLVSE